MPEFNPLLFNRPSAPADSSELGEIDPDLRRLRQDMLSERQDQVRRKVDQEISRLVLARKKAEPIQREGELMRAELAETEAAFHRLGGQGQLAVNSFGLAWSAYLCYRERYSAHWSLYRKEMERLGRPETHPPVYSSMTGISPGNVDFETFLLYGISTLDFEITKDYVKAKPHQGSHIAISDEFMVSKSCYRYEDNGYPTVVAGRHSMIVPICQHPQLERMKRDQDLSRSLLIENSLAQQQNKIVEVRPDVFASFIYIGVYELNGLDPNQPVVKATLATAAKFIVDEKDRFEKLLKIAFLKIPKEAWNDPRFQSPGQT